MSGLIIGLIVLVVVLLFGGALFAMMKGSPAPAPAPAPQPTPMPAPVPMPPQPAPAPAPAPAPQQAPWACKSLNNNGTWNIIQRRPDGLIQCMSTNGRDCFWYNSQAACQTGLGSAPSNIQPLVCGPMHQQVWGTPGTTDPAHWCYSSRTDV